VVFVQGSHQKKFRFGGNVLILLVGILLLVACGQKGALYLPDEPQTFESAALTVNVQATVAASTRH